MSNEHVAEPFRSILEAATAGTPNTPAEIYANIRDKALKDAISACEGERLHEGLDNDLDEAYMNGVTDCIMAISALVRNP